MNISNDKKSFYQWETNRFLVDEDFKINQEVCFSSVKLRKALVVKTKLKNNKIVVEVPNLLLQDYHPIMVHWVIADENGKYVTKEQEFQVLKRAKPEDYVYTETEIFSFLDLEQRLKNLEEEGINKAIADYFVKNPIQSGATSEQAAQIIQNKENIEKLNKNKLDADKLPEAINNALAQAEASGAFKGEPGKDGVVPVTGAAMGQTVKITAVDENGNPTEWEATDFPESSTQTDWNQNDESAVDYIKNKPFYEIPEVVLFDEDITLSGGNFEGREYAYYFSNELPFEAGKTYSVTYDCSSVSTTLEVTMDDDFFAGLVIDSSSSNSFGQGIITKKAFIVDWPIATSGRLTIKELGSGSIKYLDPKYIKDMYYEVPEVWTSLDVIDKGDEYFYLDYTLELDKPYTIRIDGIKYSFDSLKRGEYHSASGYYSWYLGSKIGNDGISVHTWEYPFAIWSAGYTGPKTETRVRFEDGSYNHTVEFLESEGEIHHIDPKYIKDMYYEEPVELFSIENATFDGNPYFPETPIVIEVDNTYIVNWDGVEYTCEAYTFQGIPAIGNTAEFGGKGNGEPFCIGYDKYENVTFVKSFEDLATHTFSVAEMVYHTIAPKYIKDMYYDNGATITEVVPETTVDGFTVMQDPIYGIQNAISMTPVVGATYIVNWDGTEYTTTCNSIIDIPFMYIGNENYVNMQPGGDIPFAIIFAVGNVFLATESTASSHTISVTEYNQDLKQIDTKYLPILEKVEETIIKANVTDIIELRGPAYGKLLGKYVVVIDGVSETVEFIDDGIGSFVETDSFAIESWTDPEGNVDNNGFYIEFVNQDGNSHSVEILAIKDVIKEEYLPDSVTAKPDWNQSDPENASYIENRTHHEYENLTLLKEEISVNCTQPYDDIYRVGLYAYWIGGWTNFIGKTIRVIFNGTPYDVLVDDSQNLGNLDNYPFWLWYDNNDRTYFCVKQPGTYTFALYLCERGIKHLDPKYIKDMYYEEENILLEYKTNEPVIMVQLDKPNGFDKNKSYIFEVNGVEYKDVPSGTGSNNALGGYAWCGSHLNLNGAVWDETNYPFCFTRGLTNESIYISINDTVDFPVTFKLKEEEFIIHHLNPKYIKDMYYEEVIRTDITGTRYTIDGLNASTLTVSHDPIPLKLGQVWEVNQKHYSGNWSSNGNYEVQQSDDGVLYLGAPIGTQDNVQFYLTTDELSISTALAGAGYGTFKFTCISGVTDESTIHKLDSKYLDIATDDEILEMLAEIDMLPTVTDGDGSILADENENILLW